LTTRQGLCGEVLLGCRSHGRPLAAGRFSTTLLLLARACRGRRRCTMDVTVHCSQLELVLAEAACEEEELVCRWPLLGKDALIIVAAARFLGGRSSPAIHRSPPLHRPLAAALLGARCLMGRSWLQL
ncbi:hypothetical protein Dimus_035692, partial [Dionaea muscipula]